MKFDVQLQVEPMELNADMGVIYDVTGDEYERGYMAGYAVGEKQGYGVGYSDGEVAGKAEEQAVADGIITRKIYGEYRNDRVTSILNYAFFACSGLSSIDFPKVTSIAAYGFAGCAGLFAVDFPLVVSIGNQAFNNCTQLVSFTLRANQVCSLSHSNALNGTPIASGKGYIYVPDDLADDYKAATNWATYAAQIRPLSELEG